MVRRARVPGLLHSTTRIRCHPRAASVTTRGDKMGPFMIAVRVVAAALGLALAVGAGTASAQDKKVRAQMGWAFPSSTGLLGPTQTRLVELIRSLSAGSIDVKGFEPGALVPA